MTRTNESPASTNSSNNELRVETVFEDKIEIEEETKKVDEPEVRDPDREVEIENELRNVVGLGLSEDQVQRYRSFMVDSGLTTVDDLMRFSFTTLLDTQLKSGLAADMEAEEEKKGAAEESKKAPKKKKKKKTRSKSRKSSSSSDSSFVKDSSDSEEEREAVTKPKKARKKKKKKKSRSKRTSSLIAALCSRLSIAAEHRLSRTLRTCITASQASSVRLTMEESVAWAPQ